MSITSPIAFAQEIIRIFEIIHPLDRIPRAGYLLRGVPEPESVAAHSHFMSLLALFFVETYPGTYDAKKLLAMALVHDLAEARIMDIPMPYADAYLSEAKSEAEHAISESILGGLSSKLAAYHSEFNKAESQEARLLRGLDKAQMMIKVLCYEREHRGHLEEFWLNPNNFNDYGITEVATLFDEICKCANRKKPV